jgi:hypothetical protein
MSGYMRHTAEISLPLHLVDLHKYIAGELFLPERAPAVGRKEEERQRDAPQFSLPVRNIDIRFKHRVIPVEMVHKIDIACIIEGRFPGELRDDELRFLP